MIAYRPEICGDQLRRIQATCGKGGHMPAGTETKRIWKPVVDQSADSLWLLLITSMSVTVLVTRVYLEMAGYPQIGDSTYHIAHVLWGGLLLFIALTLPLS